MQFDELTSNSVEIIGKCLEQCLCTKQNHFLLEIFGFVSPFDKAFCTSPNIDTEIVEQRFIATLVNATTKDDCNTFKSKLKDILDEAEEHEREIRKAGGEWLQSYACDNPSCFRDYATYLEHADKFAGTERKFFLKFCNTKKHGRKMWDENGKRIHHDIHTYSPICNDNYTASLYTLKQCGGKGLTETFNLFKRIIHCFIRTYQYAVGIDLYAQSLRSNPIEARIILNDSIKKALASLQIVDTNDIEKQWIDIAKKNIDEQMLANIYNKTIMQLAPAFYHLVTTGQFPWIAILIKDKENHQGILSEIECDIFKAIKDPHQREKAALETRKLIFNFDKLKSTIYETGDKGHKDKTLSDGEVLAFIVENLAQEVKLSYPMAKMVKGYFCNLRHQEDNVDKLYKAFDYARNHMPNRALKEKAFNKTKTEILKT